MKTYTLLGLVVVVIAGVVLMNTRTAYITRAAVLIGAPPASGKQFSFLPPGSTLPTDAQCAAKVRRTTWEPRPENTDENNYIAVKGTDYNLLRYGGTDNGIYKPGHAEKANTIVDRINGNFTGTTDEILQWAACKWGFDEDVARAQAVTESFWNMSAVGDNGESFGILQVRKTAQIGTYPGSVKSTAFNADYTYGNWRKCYEGLVDYLGESAAYAAGDEWGCIGVWFSGFFHTAPSETYIAAVKENLNKRIWETWQGVQVTPKASSGVPGTASPTQASCPKRASGDADCNSAVDISDFEVWRKEYTKVVATKKN